MRPWSLNCSREKDLSQYLRVYSRARPSIDSISDPSIRVGFCRELNSPFLSFFSTDLYGVNRETRNFDCGEGT